jgi:hypothetical protein
MICGFTAERDQWWCRYNRELYCLVKGTYFSAVIRITRLRWAGHAASMDEICMPRRFTYMQPEGLR